MRDCTGIFSRSGEQVATIGLNEACGLWQIVVFRYLQGSEELRCQGQASEANPVRGVPGICG
jgi:hypothetical protein